MRTPYRTVKGVGSQTSQGGGGYMCTYDPQDKTANTTRPAGADFAIVSTYHTTTPGSQRGAAAVTVDKNQIGPRNSIACGNSVYTTVNNDGSNICAYSSCANTQIAFFSKVGRNGAAAFVDVLVVGGGADGSQSGGAYTTGGCGGGGGGICHMVKMPIYVQDAIPVRIGAAANLSAFGSIVAAGGGTRTSGAPQSSPNGTDYSIGVPGGCYKVPSFGGAGGYTPGQDGCNECECLGPSRCTGGGGAYLIRYQGQGGDGYTTDISGESHTYGGGGGNGFVFNYRAQPGNYGGTQNITKLPSCGGGAGGNGFGYDKYEIPVFGYNDCYTCRVPNRCYVVNDQGDHNTDAKYYGGGGGGSGTNAGGGGGGGGGCASGTAGKGCQGVVVVRYPSDGSYGLTNDTLGGTVTTCTIDGKEWRIHTFTDVANGGCFYPVFKK